MVLAIVSWVLLIVGIILLIIRRGTDHRRELEYVGIVCTALGTVFASVFTCVALMGNMGYKNDGAYSGAAPMQQNQPWAGKNVLVVGDSVSDLSMHSHPWQETFASALGCTVTTHAKGGATLLDMIDGNERLPIDPLTQEDVAGKNLIILFGGANDINQGVPFGKVGDTETGTACGNLYYAVNRIYTLLAAADNISCPVVLAGYYNSGTEFGKDQSIRQTTANVAQWLGLPYVDLRGSGINPATWCLYGQEDNQHLTTAGNILIGNQIAKFVENSVSPGLSREVLAIYMPETLTK